MHEDVEIRQPPEMELSAQSELRLLDPPEQMQSCGSTRNRNDENDLEEVVLGFLLRGWI